jgi:hypothetical protein
LYRRSPINRLGTFIWRPRFRRIQHVNQRCAKRGYCTKAKICTNKSVMARIAALLVVIGATLATWPAAAQFGGTFGDSPPRPPANVPSGPFPAQPPPVQYPGQYPAQQQYPAQKNQRPQQNPPPQSATRAPTGIQSQPLAPPAGASAAPAPQTRAAPAPAPAAPAAAAPSQPADTMARPDDTVVTETPTQKIENARAVFAGLDKITGRTIAFDAAIGETVQFGALQVTARACYTRPPTEATNTDAFVEVDEVTLQGEIKRIFTGWMFASSPGLHAVDLRCLAHRLRAARRRSGSSGASACASAALRRSAGRSGTQARGAARTRYPAFAHAASSDRRLIAISPALAATVSSRPRSGGRPGAR